MTGPPHASLPPPLLSHPSPIRVEQSWQWWSEGLPGSDRKRGPVCGKVLQAGGGAFSVTREPKRGGALLA